ncbi:MAG: SDR family NAD(P)-dependent oxidoreductase [Thermomicrobiales bacterium]
MSDLTGKTALVTGASRGIGRAIADALAGAGAAVAVNYASRENDALAVVNTIEARSGRAIAVQADVSNAQQVESMVDYVAAKLGPVTILVNNAALTDTHKPWTAITEEEWDRVMAVNLKSCFLTLRATYPAMRHAGWGRIINISSVTWLLGRPNLLHYVSSKAGMVGFTRTLAREIGPDGITVNAITPGAIQTEAELEMFPEQEELAVRLNDLQSLHRRGVPDDIAGAVCFLASDAASFMTGQTINIDGGWAMH